MNTLEHHNVVGISEIDTRKLVRHIRSKGAMNAIISSELSDLEQIEKRLQEVPDMNGLELASSVSTTEHYFRWGGRCEMESGGVGLGGKKEYSQ